MVRQVLPEREELKVGLLRKRSQNKSLFFTRDNYNERVFVLDTVFLTYYDGTLQRRGSVKGSIELREVLAVETVVDGQVPQCGYQISYEEDGRPLILYVFASNQQDRDDWIKAVRDESLRNGAYFIPTFHPACWHRKTGFSCCQAPSRGDEGCMAVTKQMSERRERLLSKASSAGPGEVMVDMMNKRSQGKSRFFGVVNYKERVFVLDSRSLRYFDGNLRKREELKGSIELFLVFAVEYIRDGLLDNRRNAFQVVYKDDDDERLTLVVVARSGDKRQAWVQAIRDEARKSGAHFQAVYHPGIWVKSFGKYNCCDDDCKDSLGCQPVTFDLTVKSAAATSKEGQRGQGSSEVKVGMLIKRAQCKSSFYISRSLRERLFVLSHSALRYFKGGPKKRGEAKCTIPLTNMVTVATVDPKALDGRRNAFQIAYRDEGDGRMYFLYMVAPNRNQCKAWISAITSECEKAGVSLNPFFHPGVWTKTLGNFSCCGQISREAEGCMQMNQDFDLVSPSPRPLSSSSSGSSSTS